MMARPRADSCFHFSDLTIALGERGGGETGLVLRREGCCVLSLRFSLSLCVSLAHHTLTGCVHQQARCSASSLPPTAHPGHAARLQAAWSAQQAVYVLQFG